MLSQDFVILQSPPPPAVVALLASLDVMGTMYEYCSFVSIS